MNEQKTLTKLANMFRVAPSALRYWDTAGLVHFERSKENDYRYPTMQTMLEICDVLLNRSLSISIKDMQKIPDMNAQQQKTVLEEKEKELLRQKEKIIETLERIQSKKDMLDRFFALKKSTLFCTEEVKIPGIKEFSFQREEDIQKFVHNNHQSAIIVTPGGEISYALFTEKEESTLLRKADCKKKKYLKGLLQVPSDGIGKTNQEEFFKAAEQIGLKKGSILGQYLLSVSEKERFDYYEAWMETE